MSAAVFAVARPGVVPTGIRKTNQSNGVRTSAGVAPRRGDNALAGSRSHVVHAIFEPSADVAVVGDSVRAGGAQYCEWVAPRQLRNDSEAERQMLAAALSGFLPIAASESRGKTGAFCLLSKEGADADIHAQPGLLKQEGAAGGGMFAKGLLAFCLGVGCFIAGQGAGGVKHATAAVTPCATTSFGYIPASASARGEAKGAAGPHFENVICARWYVGSLNAIG